MSEIEQILDEIEKIARERESSGLAQGQMAENRSQTERVGRGW